MDVRKILMPTDFSPCANAALNHALFLAEDFDAAELDLLHVVVLHNADPMDPSRLFPDADDVDRRLQEIATSEMKELLKDCERERLTIREVTRRAVAAAPAIADYAEDEDIDLIVMGAHGRRGVRRFLIGSVAEEVVRLAPCPVLTLHGGGEETELHRFAEILVPYDFSVHSDAALGVAHGLAKEHGGRLRVVHVIEPIMEPHPYVPVHYRPEEFDLAQLTERVREDLTARVGKVCGKDVAFEVEVLEGSPGLVIAEHAEETGADLVVITTHGRTGITRFLLGSVAEKVVRTAECPVLTLKAA